MNLRPRPPLPPGPYLVAGLGRAGRSAVDALLRQVPGDQIVAWDEATGREMRRRARQLEELGVRTLLGPPPTRRDVGRAHCVVKSPGLSWQLSVLQRALMRGRTVVDELELGWRLSRVPVVGVTGTNGKSTVCALLTAIMRADKRAVQLVGNTAYGPPLSGADRDAELLVCEVSSYQLEYSPAMLPELAVFTNLTPEHLGRHRTMERYGAIKRKLFLREQDRVERAVVDVDDPFGARLAGDLERNGSQVRRVGFSDRADYRILEASWTLRKASLTLETPNGHAELITQLPGAYNARNVAGALAAAELLGVSAAVSHPAVAAEPGPQGRFRHVDAGQPFTVITDFAHTPDGLRQLLEALRAAMAPGARLINVVGCASRTTASLYELGRVARPRSDELVLTTSGYFGEPPIPALKAILDGARASHGGRVSVVLDRRHAIDAGLSLCRPGDVMVIPIRGALTHICNDRRGVALPFDDAEVAEDLLAASGWRSGRAPSDHDGAQAARAVSPQSVGITARRFSAARRPSRTEYVGRT